MSTPLDFAQADLAAGIASSGGRFRGAPFDLYALPGEEPLAWCGRAVRTWYSKAGTELPGNRFLIGSVQNLHDALVAAGMFLDSDAEPQPNDLILLEGTANNRDGLLIGGHHVGLVESVTPDTVVSIDGDFGTPDRVMRVTRERSASDIWGYGRVLKGGGLAGSVAPKLVGAYALWKVFQWWRRRRRA
jgi:hypothetical protein